MLLELESEGGGITGWSKEGRASLRRHPSRLECGGSDEQDRGTECGGVKTLGTHVLVGTSPHWPWRVVGFSLEPSAAGGDEWGR